MAQGTVGTLAGTNYNDRVVRQFALMTIAWGVVGMSVGLLLAADHPARGDHALDEEPVASALPNSTP